MSKWIPVADGLPKELGIYLVTKKNGTVGMYEWTCIWNGTKYLWRQMDYSPLDDVIAWMPLPEPYGGDEA